MREGMGCPLYSFSNERSTRSKPFLTTGSEWLIIDELPRSKLTGYQNTAMRIYPKGVTPECFNQGSSSGFAWIPDRSIRE